MIYFHLINILNNRKCIGNNYNNCWKAAELSQLYLLNAIPEYNITVDHLINQLIQETKTYIFRYFLCIVVEINIEYISKVLKKIDIKHIALQL